MSRGHAPPVVRTRHAFALPELLVVIAIIAVLLSLVAGGLNTTKARAQRTECSSNLRQIMLAWQRHYTDNDDQLVPNYRPQSAANTLPTPWVSGDYHYAYDCVTNFSYLTDPRFSAFAGTLPNARLYRCPSARQLIQGRPLTRSYGLNQYMGAGANSSALSNYAAFTRVHDVVPPAQMFTFLELNPVTICTSMMRVPMDTNLATGFFHLPSFAHEGRVAMAFADGHIEAYGIRDKDSLRTYQVDWLADHDIPMTNADVLAIREMTSYLK